MLEKFYGWVKTIAACLIFLSLIIRLLPEGKNIKYIRYFMGMVLVLVVLAPAGRLFGLEKVFSQLEISFEREGARADFEGELALMGEVYAEEVVRGYEEELAAEVLRFLEREGYGDCSVRVTIDAEEDSETFGRVKQLEIFPFESRAEEGETGKIVIEKKKVQILSEEPPEKNYLEEAQEGEWRKLLAEEFSVPEEAVRIVR
ncbi:MAG: stage III sporulation protein AF [Lachnospiraceae bacterium]|nr:stage III sporulation protein AF [Lachnospiraceae bacterium]